MAAVCAGVNAPCARPSASGTADCDSIDWAAGYAIATPTASSVPSAMSSHTWFKKGYDAANAQVTRSETIANVRRSKRSTKRPATGENAANGSANSVQDRPICHAAAPRELINKLQHVSYTPTIRPLTTATISRPNSCWVRTSGALRWSVAWTRVRGVPIQIGTAADMQTTAVAMNSQCRLSPPAMLPASGPSAMPASCAANTTANARPRPAAGTTTPTSARPATCTAPAPMPWSPRNATYPPAPTDSAKHRLAPAYVAKPPRI